ncbi:MAG: N-acetylmuramoyl-L-alanine amidase [Proteobacteria bacterium]|nr:N-acetylmuramoyl-L-alanine amidase [Pseudomonadota bacterium]
MIQKNFLKGILVVLAGLAPLDPAAAAAGAAELRAVRVSADADNAQVALDVRGNPGRKVFLLQHPDRVVVDLSNTRLAPGVRAPAGGGVVSGVRFGRQPHGTLRVVVQLTRQRSARSHWSDSHRQLLVEVGQGLKLPGVKSAARATAGAATPAASPAPSGMALAAPPKAAPAGADAAGQSDADAAPVRAAHAPGEGDRDVIIAVDAGHGGQDPGAIGRGGTREKDVTLAIARALADEINTQGGMHAVLTRDRDEFLELRERIRRARAAHADMFVSVHADSIGNPAVSGASVYVLSTHGASNEAARWLAERENAADLAGGVRLDDKGSLAPVLLDAAQSEIIGVSATAAERVVSALHEVGEVRKREVQHAGFVVLKSPDIPSMLVETAYISNPEDERRLRSRPQQERLAQAIAGGVRDYFQQNPPDGTRLKQQRRLASVADTP